MSREFTQGQGAAATTEPQPITKVSIIVSKRSLKCV